MKIAYLITAYQDPEQLMLLVQSLGHHHFYIHIDKKYDDGPFKALLSSVSTVYWIADRVKIAWGGDIPKFSQYLNF